MPVDPNGEFCTPCEGQLRKRIRPLRAHTQIDARYSEREDAGVHDQVLDDDA
jgi:hypothetical protein